MDRVTRQRRRTTAEHLVPVGDGSGSEELLEVSLADPRRVGGIPVVGVEFDDQPAVVADLTERRPDVGEIDDALTQRQERERIEADVLQMDVSDPEQLRPFLRRVTQIKQEALRELTSEKVRGDQLFAIFLSQCAALSEKIQMRMLYGRMSEDAVEQV